jgi:hypothetical protein
LLLWKIKPHQTMLICSDAAGHSEWTVGESTVYLKSQGGRRQFYFLEPSADLVKLGAQPCMQTVRRSMRPMKVRSLFLQDVVEMDIAMTFRVQLRTVMAQ